MAQQHGEVPRGNPAEAYERHYVPAIFSPWAQVLVQRAAPQPGERALDVACGTGVVARRVAPLLGATGQVVGMDVSPAMLAVARSLPPPEGAAIECRDGDAAALPVPDAAFDLVCCQQGLQFVPDRAAALRERRRALAPGGRAALSVWAAIEHNPVQAMLHGLFARHLGTPPVPAPFSLGDADELRALLDGVGFRAGAVEAVTLTVRFPSAAAYVAESVQAVAAVLPAFAGLDDAARTALVAAVSRDAEPTLRRYRDGDGLAYPSRAHVALARR